MRMEAWSAVFFPITLPLHAMHLALHPPLPLQAPIEPNEQFNEQVAKAMEGKTGVIFACEVRHAAGPRRACRDVQGLLDLPLAFGSRLVAPGCKAGRLASLLLAFPAARG